MGATAKRVSAGTQTIIEALDEILRHAGSPERAAKERAYLKSPIHHYGASVPAIRKAASAAAGPKQSLSRGQLLDLVDRLWSSTVHEHRMAAVTLLEERVDLLTPRDLALVERMIRSSFTWAYVDNLAASVAGPLVERHPQLAGRLDCWAKDECFWLRRSAMLALLLPIRSGGGDWKRFTRYADAMLDEKEFFIRKAIGWVLREAAKKRPDRVRRYVASRLDRLSPLSFREAIKRLPDREQTALGRAYDAARRTGRRSAQAD